MFYPCASDSSFRRAICQKLDLMVVPIDGRSLNHSYFFFKWKKKERKKIARTSVTFVLLRFIYRTNIITYYFHNFDVYVRLRGVYFSSKMIHSYGERVFVIFFRYFRTTTTLRKYHYRYRCLARIYDISMGISMGRFDRILTFFATITLRIGNNFSYYLVFIAFCVILCKLCIIPCMLRSILLLLFIINNIIFANK